MFKVQHYKYVGTGSSSERTYDLVSITPTSDIHPSFLIRRWGKSGHKGSAKIEMFDRASRAQVGIRAEIRKRKDKDYKSVGENTFSAYKGSSVINRVHEECLPMLNRDHDIFQVLKEIEKVGRSEEDQTALDEVYNGILPDEPVVKVEYSEWGTW